MIRPPEACVFCTLSAPGASSRSVPNPFIFNTVRLIMSPIEQLSSTPNPAVLLFDFESAPAGLEESLAATLPEATRSRITAFCHPVRRRQTRWGRILASAAARILDAELVEEPPYAPYLLKDGRRTALCIAHTGTSIALGIASVNDPAMGLDLETMRPVRSIEGMSRMSFGEAASAVVRQCAESGDSEPFFRAWGMKESEIKLNRGGSGWRLTLDEESRPVVLDPEGRPVLATHAAFGSLRLTVLTGACTPAIGRVTPADIARTLL